MKIGKTRLQLMFNATLVSSIGLGALLREPQDERAHLLKGHCEWVNTVAFAPDGRGIISGAGDHELTSETRFWNLTSLQARDLSGHTGSVEAIAFSRDGTQLATAGYDQTIRLWDLRHGFERTAALAGHDGPIHHLAYSADGATLISAGTDHNVLFWDITSAKIRSRLTGHDVLALAPRGGCFATREIAHGAIAIRNLTSGTCCKTIEVDNHWTMCAAFRADGRSFAVGGFDRKIAIYRLDDTKLLWSLSGHQDYLIVVAFSSDGRWLASGSQDRTVKIWDLETGQEVCTLVGHTGPVTSVAFAPDGKRLVSGSYDKTIRVWDLAEIYPETRRAP